MGFIITSLDNKGKVRSAVIDTELLDDSNRTVKKFQENIKIALDNGEPEVATLFINGYDDENGIHHPGLMDSYIIDLTLLKRDKAIHLVNKDNYGSIR